MSAAQARPVPGDATVAAQPQAFSWQGPKQAKIGDRITIALNTQAQQDAGGLGLLVGYDPAVLKAIDVTPGDWLQTDGQPPGFTHTIDQPSGQILVDMKGAASGEDGSVVMLSFEVTAATPQSPVTASRVTLSGTAGEPLAAMPPAPHFIAVTP
jgi:general secretion pathway protein D